MTSRPFPEVARLARSWNHPAALRVAGAGVTSEAYCKPERAYHVACPAGGAKTPLEIELAGSEASPIANPAFVIRNWGGARPDVSIDGRRMPGGPNLRVGFRHGLEGTDLVLWIGLEATRPVRMRIVPAGS
jgi:hypothetical protein